MMTIQPCERRAQNKYYKTGLVQTKLIEGKFQSWKIYSTILVISAKQGSVDVLQFCNGCHKLAE